ncbi:MAG: diguanylate cyclase [Deltaproteobacteria bacterium CG_4_10_14_0_2_um_filter_43_8]|nr:MAG: diguanylate cyclase [Deltaproteobacteria bacterium CG11_big_fil_rev_8_21_14_0_20_42_23]PJA19960.1 MAG: diguanylate cyclase [Deltaproteobacteria bacterium CG_4_10_14_0_2_um_filter_43_8]PJC63612.1 MAG: diguanylate cyclase [Deltaproteobacteria bacterium CG_4_9_14_0_2_um_filter_42_21]
MLAYLLKRFFLLIPTFFGITLITFFIVQLAPGDPASLKAQAGNQMIASDAVHQQIVEDTKKLYGLDKPLPVQYLLWVSRVVRFDFGTSFRDHRPVMDKISDALPITLTLNVLTIFLIYLISLPLGTYAALKPNSLFDRVSALILFVLYSLPSFWVAMMLVVLFAGDVFNWFPLVGFISDGADQLSFFGRIGNVLWHLVLPLVCLTYGGFSFLARFARVSVLEVISQDYIRTARAKGLSEWKVVMKHGFRNALIPLLTLMSTLLPALLGGSVIIEQIFSLPGMGRLGFESVLARDYPVVLAIATISAFLTLVSILITDLLYVFVDPRISFSRRRV